MSHMLHDRATLSAQRSLAIGKERLETWKRQKGSDEEASRKEQKAKGKKGERERERVKGTLQDESVLENAMQLKRVTQYRQKTRMGSMNSQNYRISLKAREQRSDR